MPLQLQLPMLWRWLQSRHTCDCPWAPLSPGLHAALHTASSGNAVLLLCYPSISKTACTAQGGGSSLQGIRALAHKLAHWSPFSRAALPDDILCCRDTRLRGVWRSLQCTVCCNTKPSEELSRRDLHLAGSTTAMSTLT